MILLKSLATPIIWVLALCAIGLALTRCRQRQCLARAGWFLMLAGVLLLWGLSLTPVANFLTYYLESQHSPPSLEAIKTLDVVVVLGGGLYPSGGLRAEAHLAEPAFPRLYHGVKVFKQTNADLLALCGGGTYAGTETEAQVMEVMAIHMGVPSDKILTETRSRDTQENGALLAGLLPPGRNRRVGLVTSATHMPRALRVFTRQFPDDTIIPIPTYFTYSPPVWTIRYFVPSVDALEKSSVSLHEWIGLLWYSLRY